MTCRLNLRVRSFVASILLALPVVATAQQAHADPTPAERWQQWLERQKQVPVGAWAYTNALDDDAILSRYTAARFTIMPRARWPQGLAVAAGTSAALDLSVSSDRSIEVIKRLIESGPAPALVLLGQEVTPDQFRMAAEQTEAVNGASGGAALPLNSLLPNWYCYFDRMNMTYEQYIEQFIAESKPEALMAAEFPLMADGTDRTFYYDQLDVLRRESLDHGIGLFGVVQAIGHGPRYRQPSASDLRWQVNCYLAYGAKGLWYYFFAGNGSDDGLTTGLAWYPKQLGPAATPLGFGVDETPAAKRTLETIRQINSEVAALSPTLLKLRSTAVFHSGHEPPPGVMPLRDDAASPLTGFTGDDFLVGVFRKARSTDGDTYVMIVNERHGPDVQTAAFESEATFKLKAPFQSVEVVDTATGSLRPLATGPTGFTVHLVGGQGVLLHCR